MLEDRPVPEPRVGEALVRVVACGVCHTDLHYLDHGVATAKPPPLILGHEVAGIVERLGPGASAPAPGTPVVVPAVVSCGRCEACGTGRGNLCATLEMFGNHRDGGFAEYVTAPASELVPLPPDLPLEDAALIADGVTTAYHAVRRRAEVGAGDTVAVFGCGGVGLAIVQLAAGSGARVVAVDLDAGRLTLARELGAIGTVTATRDGGAAKAVKQACPGGVDVAIEVAGVPAALREALASVRPGGRVVLVGYGAEDVPLPVGRIMFRELELRGSLGCRRADYARVVELVRAGTFRLRRREGVRTLLCPGRSSATNGGRG